MHLVETFFSWLDFLFPIALIAGLFVLSIIDLAGRRLGHAVFEFYSAAMLTAIVFLNSHLPNL
jgi:hypothetical protein